jgi:hypothetical protein
VSVRARTGGVVDDPDDMDLAYWAGVLPLRRVAGSPEPDEGVVVPAPPYLTADESYVAEKELTAKP